MSTPRHIVLMGLRGSGKSSAGRLLAARLGLPFSDLDDLTPAMLGRSSVAEVWNLDGEPAFRAAEARALAHVLDQPPSVIGLGGGTPTAPGVSDMLRLAESTGIVLIYLRASAAQLRDHLHAGGLGDHRPSLTGKDPLQEIDDVLRRRDPLYSDLASVVLEVGELSLESVVDAIMALPKVRAS